MLNLSLSRSLYQEISTSELEFIEAAINDDTEAIKQLLEKKANVNAVIPSTGESPLHLAAIKGNAEAMKLLLESKADMYARTTTALKDTPMHCAIMSEELEAVKALTAAGFNVNFSEGSSVLLDSACYSRNMLLDRACHYRNMNILQHLLETKANTSVAPEAIFKASLHPYKLDLMLKHGAKVNVQKSRFDLLDPGATPLHYVIDRTTDTMAIKMLLKANADPNTIDARGKTPREHLAERIDSLFQIKEMTLKIASDFIELIPLLKTDKKDTPLMTQIFTKLRNFYKESQEPAVQTLKEDCTTMPVISEVKTLEEDSTRTAVTPVIQTLKEDSTRTPVIPEVRTLKEVSMKIPATE